MKTFPMFLSLAGRRVLILGGGEQAAQKTRLMLKTEARIVVAAPELEPELAALATAGRIAHHPGPLSRDVLAGAALAFVATGCRGADRALADVGRAAGVLVNVVDAPDLCDAYTPSIVDRDPVVVAIGTEGTAPVLARQIKTRIETLLEPVSARSPRWQGGCGRKQRGGSNQGSGGRSGPGRSPARRAMLMHGGRSGKRSG